MTFSSQLEKIRSELKRRIAASLITQSELAQKSRVSQPVISNFVHGAGVSWKSADAIAAALGLRDEDLVDSPAAVLALPKGHPVPLVAQITAIVTPIIKSRNVLQWTDIFIESLDNPVAHPSRERALWTRFVAIDTTKDQTGPMFPYLKKAARLVIDRHCQDAQTHYEGRRAIYAISGQSILRFGFLQRTGAALEIHQPDLGTQRIEVEYIVGRVCDMVARSRP